MYTRGRGNLDSTSPLLSQFYSHKNNGCDKVDPVIIMNNRKEMFDLKDNYTVT